MRRCITQYFYWFFKDYFSATYMLTWDEDLAYRRMLELQYSTEKPLPFDREKLYSALRVSTREQKQAVEKVLKSYFKRTRGRNAGYVNLKAIKQINRYHSQQIKNSNAGKQSALVRNGRSTDTQRSLHHLNNQYPIQSKTSLPSAGAEDAVRYVSRYEDIIEVQMGRKKNLPELNGHEGARAQQIAQMYTSKGFPARVLTRAEIENMIQHDASQDAPGTGVDKKGNI